MGAHHLPMDTDEKVMTNSPQLTFIGAGNMANAIINGLMATNYPKSALTVCAPVEQELKQIEQQFGIMTTRDNTAPIADSDVIILCVKPKVMEQVCREISAQVQHYQPLIISIAAGISTKQLTAWLGGPGAVVRCMPNTPAQVHRGASGLYANAQVASHQRSLAQNLFESVGSAFWLAEEKQLHAVTALSGSGPAYCFWFLEAMEQAATGLGLSAQMARQLAIQTMRGAAELAGNSDESPARLKQRVMSPGGTTERAIARFDKDNMATIVAAAMEEAWVRSYQLAGETVPKKRQ